MYDLPESQWDEALRCKFPTQPTVSEAFRLITIIQRDSHHPLRVAESGSNQFKRLKNALGSKFDRNRVDMTLHHGSTATPIILTTPYVLKISEKDHFRGRKHEPSFDAPIREKQSSDRLHTYYQAKAKTEFDKPNIITRAHLRDLEQRIKNAGYNINYADFESHQVGLINGTPYLLDPECVY